MSSGDTARQRKGKARVSASPSPSAAINGSATSSKQGRKPSFRGVAKTPVFNKYICAKAVLIILAFATRFYILGHPSEVVFDEVHFGKFASYYLRHTYFFDLHPPFAKLLIAFVGKLVGYDGRFLFDEIGDSYISNQVPYLAYRSLSAILGAMTVPLIFDTLRHAGYSVYACVLGSSLVLFDNAHICETRLILLDATLVCSIAGSIYAYTRFSKCRDAPFTSEWYKWLCITGVALSCVISTKYVGILTFAMVGTAVVIDLWNLLDYRRRISINVLIKHIVARAMCLIVLPLSIFLFWFWVHFRVLSHSGPGDAFMSPEFQATLSENILAQEAKEVRYYDFITLRNKETLLYLGSNENHYPLRYDDGRVSSQGQVVVTNTGNKAGEYFQILPETDFAPDQPRTGVPVVVGQKIRLLHVQSNTILKAHDVASPYFPTNEEFTTIPASEALGADYPFTLFEMQLTTGRQNAQIVKTRATQFRFIHSATKVAMWTHNDIALPDWAGPADQYEVNGSKDFQDKGVVWYFDEIVGLNDERKEFVKKEPKQMSFFRKYFELQRTMFSQNNALTSEHPYASEPLSWPVLLRGVSFWTNNKTQTQIYFIGNYVGFWLCAVLMASYAAIVLVDLVTRRRGVYLVNRIARSKLYNSMGFYIIGWMCHYFPFFLMSRQKFLHHYLPAHLISCLIAAGVFDFIMGTFDESTLINKRAGGASTPRKNNKILVATTALLAAIIGCYVYFAPVTYGWPSLTPAQVQARQWMDVKLHFGK